MDCHCPICNCRTITPRRSLALTFDVLEQEHDILVRLRSRCGMYSPSLAMRYLDSFHSLLGRLVSAPNQGFRRGAASGTFLINRAAPTMEERTLADNPASTSGLHGDRGPSDPGRRKRLPWLPTDRPQPDTDIRGPFRASLVLPSDLVLALERFSGSPENEPATLLAAFAVLVHRSFRRRPDRRRRCSRGRGRDGIGQSRGIAHDGSTVLVRLVGRSRIR